MDTQGRDKTAFQQFYLQTPKYGFHVIFRRLEILFICFHNHKKDMKTVSQLPGINKQTRRVWVAGFDLWVNSLPAPNITRKVVPIPRVQGRGSASASSTPSWILPSLPPYHPECVRSRLNTSQHWLSSLPFSFLSFEFHQKSQVLKEAFVGMPFQLVILECLVNKCISHAGNYSYYIYC